MNAQELVKELCDRELCGAPVYVHGGDEWPDHSGWYYDFGGSICEISDVIKTRPGFGGMGDTWDNVSGPFETEEAAVADLIEFAGNEDGAEYIANIIRRDDERVAAFAAEQEARAQRRKEKRKAKKARWLANKARRASAGN